MHVPEIIQVKESLAEMKENGLISAWELPYENLLTRRSAAIFFVDVPNSDGSLPEEITSNLDIYEHFSFRANDEKTLSKMQLRITFNREEKLKNEQASVSA